MNSPLKRAGAILGAIGILAAAMFGGTMTMRRLMVMIAITITTRTTAAAMIPISETFSNMSITPCSG